MYQSLIKVKNESKNDLGFFLSDEWLVISYTLLFKETIEVVLPPIKMNVPALNS